SRVRDFGCETHTPTSCGLHGRSHRARQLNSRYQHGCLGLVALVQDYKIKTQTQYQPQHGCLGLPRSSPQKIMNRLLANPGLTLAFLTTPRYLHSWRISLFMLKPDLIHLISAGYAAFLQPAHTPDFLIAQDILCGGYRTD
ncbi:MAG: hypothetical protein KDJ70_14985, partial [Candidatus Competibacteraceae bacterium]|nr:hypothetical protein [Candidatus Competibacteraceae bacterium]